MRKILKNIMFCSMLVCLLALLPQAASAAVTRFTSGDTTGSLDSTTGILTISGTGAMADYTSASGTPWYSYRYAVDGIVVEEGVTDIGNYAFASMYYLTDVTLPSTLQTIGDYAFTDQGDALTVSIPNCSVAMIAQTAFDDDVVVSAAGTAGELTWTLRSGTLSVSGTGEIPDYSDYYDYMFSPGAAPWSALLSRDYVNRIDIGKGITRIGDNAFELYDDTGTLTVTLPEGLVSIGDGAFEYGNMTSITFPSSLREIGANAFSGASWLSSVYLNDGLETLGDSAFYGAWNGIGNNTSLTSVRIPSSLKNWGRNTFSGHSNLSSITLEPGLTMVGENAFSNISGL